MSRAVLLLSGGMDSATSAAWALASGHEVAALTLDYGQRNRFELDAACRVAAMLGITDHRRARVDLAVFAGSALTGDGEIPLDRQRIGEDIPSTYVPARNTVLLSLLVALAEVTGAELLVIGANAQDFSGYPDCRPAFLRRFEEVARLGTRSGSEGAPLRVVAPLLHLSKAGIVALASSLGVALEQTMSCYGPPQPRVHCGRCDACGLRRRGFESAGIPDPTHYAS